MLGQQSQAEIADHLMAVNEMVNGRSDYPLLDAVQEAANHISFAAESDDASANIIRGAKAFESAIAGIVFRANLIKLYAQDARSTNNQTETVQLANEVRKLSVANIEGIDIDGDGFIGNQPREHGIRQLRRDLDAMIKREKPAYTTVDRWYLLNLIRLPSGAWLFRRRNSSDPQGY